MPAFTDFRYILHENKETRNAMWRKRGKDSLPILPFLPCLLSKNSHFCAIASQNGGVNRNRQIGYNCAINCGIRGFYSNKNLIQSKNLFAVKSISNLVQRLARYRSGALISIGRLCMSIIWWGIRRVIGDENGLLISRPLASPKYGYHTPSSVRRWKKGCNICDRSLGSGCLQGRL